MGGAFLRGEFGGGGGIGKEKRALDGVVHDGWGVLDCAVLR